MNVRLCFKCELPITVDNPSSTVDDNDNEWCNGCALCAHGKPLNAPCGECYRSEMMLIVNGIGGFHSMSAEFIRENRWCVTVVFPDLESSFPFQEKLDYAPLTITNIRHGERGICITVATDCF